MKIIESIASDFYHSFYLKEWYGEQALVLDLSIEEAYDVQDLVTEKRIESGETIAGFKVGCTSNSIRKQFGLSEPINGKLFYPHTAEGQVYFDWSNYIHCAIEPEMVLRIGKTLEGKNLLDRDLIDAIDYVSPGIEIHEYNFWIKPPSIQELICSGGIHTGLIIGDQRVSPEGLHFKDEKFSVYKNDSFITSAPASEIMGGPIHSLRWLVNFLTDRGLSLEKDSFVIPGSPVELVHIDQDLELKIVIENVGSVSVYFKKDHSK